MEHWLNKKTFIWCPGCPDNWLAVVLGQLFDLLGLKKDNLWLVSGIGCAGRVTSYFSCHTIHTTHGRATSVAEGIKLVRPENDVFVVSGDGDLLSIGFSNLIHSARRGVPIKVICVNNAVYGMTGGQTSPTTPKNLITKVHPGGVPYFPLEPRKILPTLPRVFFGRTIVYNSNHFLRIAEQAYDYPGFAFIELVSFCRVNDPRFAVSNKQEEAVAGFLRKFKIVGRQKELAEWELGSIIGQ